MRFNGATGFRRWKLRAMPTNGRIWAGVLQWGHRLSPVETPTERLRKSAMRKGFNGATGFRRWKLDTCGPGVDVNRRFNGATGFRRWKPG